MNHGLRPPKAVLVKVISTEKWNVSPSDHLPLTGTGTLGDMGRDRLSASIAVKSSASRDIRQIYSNPVPTGKGSLQYRLMKSGRVGPFGIYT
jgi:hypothetical protein